MLEEAKRSAGLPIDQVLLRFMLQVLLRCLDLSSMYSLAQPQKLSHPSQLSRADSLVQAHVQQVPLVLFHNCTIRAIVMFYNPQHFCKE